MGLKNENKRYFKISHHQRKAATTLHALMQASYQVEANLIGVDSFPPMLRTIEDIMSAKTTFYGRLRHSKLVGLIEFSEDQLVAEIHSLVVHPQYFGQGFGTELVRKLMGTVSSKEIKVSTAQANKPAIGLYQKLGFQMSKNNRTECGIKLVELELSPL